MASDNKASKKKKLTSGLKANSVDNTASVKKILDELHPKNRQAFQFYAYNLKQRRTTKTYLRNLHFAVPGYPINAFSEDWDGRLNVDYFERFTYKSLYPKMITNLRHIGKCDPLSKQIKAEKDWEHKLEVSKMASIMNNMLEKCETLNDEVVRCPKHLIDMAAHLDTKPDPYLDSTYNWYYAGNGNLQLVCIDWIDYLLYSEFHIVYLSQFNKPDISIMDVTATFECGQDDNILETISSNNFVVLRTKNKVYILKFVTYNDEIKFEKLKVIRSELPYTSVCFDNYHKNILYVTTLDHKLSIINTDRMKARTVKLNAPLKTLVDNWNTVIGTGREIYTHVTKKTISVYDKRANNNMYVWNDVTNVADDITCNDISAAKHFEGTPYLYVATEHHLLLMDSRYHQNNKLKVVQRWTHGMEVIPTYMSYCHFEFNKDLICLSSQWCEDMCLIPNYNDRFLKDTESGGMTIPYRPPSIFDTLYKAREKMMCIDFYNPIAPRLSTAITGSLVLDQGEKYNVLLQNALGDISCHILYPEHLDTFIEDESPQCLHEWAKDNKFEKAEFEMSSVQNIAGVLKKLKKVPADFKVEGPRMSLQSKFNEEEITDTFENEDIEYGLHEIWTKSEEQPTGEQSFFNLYYSDEENSRH